MIDLREAIQKLESGVWVSLDYISYDAKKKAAGEIIRIPKCRLFGAGVKSGSCNATSTDKKPTKIQNHHYHATRNVKTPSGAVRKVHLRLIFQINEERVL